MTYHPSRPGARMNRFAGGLLLTLVISELTVATAYIHLNLGGLLFTLNGLGYLVLGATYIVAAVTPVDAIRRFGWLPRIGLAGYTLVTIGAYLVIGPWFDLGWIAKGIEVAIVGLLIVDMLNVYESPTGIVWAAVDSFATLRRRGGPSRA
jgi:hypothetical protein